MVSSKILRFFPGDWGFFIPRIFKFNNSENFYTRGIVTDSKFFQKSIKKFWYHADDSWLSAESGLGLDFSGIHNPHPGDRNIKYLKNPHLGIFISEDCGISKIWGLLYRQLKILKSGDFISPGFSGIEFFWG